MLPPSPHGVRILRAQTDDVPRIQEIVNAAYQKYIPRIGRAPAPMTTDYTTLLTTHDVFVVVPVEGLEIVGSIVLKADDKTMKLNNVVVDPEAQGKGYGRVLLNCADDWARMKGCNEVALFTNVHMTENLKLYAKIGYEEAERKTEDGFERIYFRKNL